MPNASLTLIHQNQRDFFATHQTQDVAFRIAQLHKLRGGMRKHERALLHALHDDLHKNPTEAFFAEIGVPQTELTHALAHIRTWSRPRTVLPALVQLPSVCWVQMQPHGTSLIIAPWNYPVQLILNPLIGALAAGNTAVLKPSEFTPTVSRALAEMIADTFDPRVVALVEGDADTSQALLRLSWDFIFFTGSPSVGQVVAQAAAANLTPTVLELGGKSPCVVDADVDIATAAKRIAWGKWTNAGQTCVAPDYVLVDKRVSQELLGALGKTIRAFFGDDPATSKDYGRIVNDRHFERVRRYLPMGRIVCGGQTDAATRYIAPTVMTDVDLNSALMQDEIFGPLLPVIEYENLDWALQLINSKPKPLSLYVFSNRKSIQQKVLCEADSGNACVNECVAQFGSPNMPFGGVGASGMGAYHGQASFHAFSHARSVLKRVNNFDFWFRWMPYSKTAERLFRLLMR